MGNIETKVRYKVKKENINKLKLFLKQIKKNGKQHKLGEDIRK